MTFLGVVALLVGIAAVVTLLMRLGPHYLDWTTMETILDDLARENVHQMSKADIRGSLAKRFRVNSLRGFDMREVIKIERNKVDTSLIVEYEKREPIVFNIDVVLRFSGQHRYQ
jgi:hypothetical protein